MKYTVRLGVGEGGVDFCVKAEVVELEDKLAVIQREQDELFRKLMEYVRDNYGLELVNVNYEMCWCIAYSNEDSKFYRVGIPGDICSEGQRLVEEEKQINRLYSKVLEKLRDMFKKEIVVELDEG